MQLYGAAGGGRPAPLPDNCARMTSGERRSETSLAGRNRGGGHGGARPRRAIDRVAPAPSPAPLRSKQPSAVVRCSSAAASVLPVERSLAGVRRRRKFGLRPVDKPSSAALQALHQRPRAFTRHPFVVAVVADPFLSPPPSSLSLSHTAFIASNRRRHGQV